MWVCGGDLGPETSEPGSALALGSSTARPGHQGGVLGLRVPLVVGAALDGGWWGHSLELRAHIGEWEARRTGSTELLRGRGGGLRRVPLPCLSCPTWASGPAHSCWGWHLRGGRVVSGAHPPGSTLAPALCPHSSPSQAPQTSSPPTMMWQREELPIQLAGDWGPHTCISTWVVGEGRLTTLTPVRFSHSVRGWVSVASGERAPARPSKPHLGSLCLPVYVVSLPSLDNSLMMPPLGCEGGGQGEQNPSPGQLSAALLVVSTWKMLALPIVVSTEPKGVTSAALVSLRAFRAPWYKAQPRQSGSQIPSHGHCTQAPAESARAPHTAWSFQAAWGVREAGWAARLGHGHAKVGVGVGWGAAFCRNLELGALDLVSEMSPRMGWEGQG